MKKSILIILLLLIFSLSPMQLIVSAFDENLEVVVYSVYDEDFNLLFQKDVVEVGDSYLSKDYKFYEVVFIDDDTHKGIAKFIKQMPKPNISVNKGSIPIKITDKTIAMYSTHNDESYVPTDGVDSVYGNGGIKDVALEFKKQLEKHFIDVYYDDTLHIPHDSGAYGRSVNTAKKLQSTYTPDAIFDIHRDGTSRKFYVANVDGVERGRVRMVIGKSNPNMALNEEFAMYLMAVGNELYPWLFTDIYYGKGHYNQSLDSKAILFEMGCHLIEKELMLDSMKELAEVVNTAMYGTTVNTNTGDITVNGFESEEEVIVNEIMEEKENDNTNILVVCIVVVVFSVVSLYAIIIFASNVNKSKKETSIIPEMKK
ncbi:MAG: hypothetical protein E7345_04400 [Clostridiales bacterium]|nr:hypothetical protein [Clostridiales bacterium]